MKFTEYTFSKRFPAVECAVFVIHQPANHRPWIEYDPHTGVPDVVAMRYRGTAAAIILPDGRYWTGVALCSPSDPYVRVVGRQKALGRAFQALRTGQQGSGYVNEHGKIVFAVGNNWAERMKKELAANIADAQKRRLTR